VEIPEAAQGSAYDRDLMPRIRPDVANSRRAFAEALGERLQAARLRAGQSQAAAAKHIGVSQNAMARLEQGSRQLSFLEAIGLARTYGVDVREFEPTTAHDEPGPAEGSG